MTDYHSIKSRAAEMGIPLEVALGKRKHFLQDEIRYWTNTIQAAKRDAPFGELEKKLSEWNINEAIKELKRLTWEVSKLNPNWIENHGEINRETIAQAKSYPIAQLLSQPLKHNMVRCPFHEDHNPSATIKGNFFYCFVCHIGLDSIGLAMKLQNLTFKEAVLSLSGNR